MALGLRKTLSQKRQGNMFTLCLGGFTLEFGSEEGLQCGNAEKTRLEHGFGGSYYGAVFEGEIFAKMLRKHF